MPHQVTVSIGGRDLILETGRMAKQANGAVFAKYEGSAVLATVCCGSSPMESLDFVPLQVEYNEKYYAAGKIPGGFLKREGRPKDKEILVSRLIDRPMRPLFSKEFKRELQIIPTTVSADQINPPDIVAMNAASAAVCVSDIPFAGPVGAVRIANVDDELIINPSFDQISRCTLEIVVSGTKDGITMVEGGAKEVPEELLLSAIALAEPAIKKLCEAQEQLMALAGKEKLPLVVEEKKLERRQEMWDFAYPKMEEACFVKGKMNRGAAVKAVKTETAEAFADDLNEDNERLFNALMEEMETKVVRSSILDKGVRTDGRDLETVRPITCEVGILDRAHGSALFTRGETQSLAVTTLGTVYDEQMMDNIDGDKTYENFMLHYNFPPFSVGETGRLTTGRREIGHGHLAHRALEAVLPQKKDFPYTIRVVSEILESNGSSSMATVCGGTLSLLHAGVPIRKPVAGIAMGLVSEGDRAAVLTDILGEEDHLGDMDFKVAGTEDGITAFQMDIKIAGISSDLMKRALEQAKKGRMHILGIMNATLKEPVSDVSDFAPKILSLKVDVDKIGAIIGPGGKTIKAIAEQSGSEVNIDDNGTVTIFGKTKEKAEKAREFIKAIVEEPEVGKIYEGTVKRIMDFGAFVEILPGKEGLCHISKLSRKRVNSVSDVLAVDQKIPVKLIEIDRQGRLNLSYIDALEAEEAK
ncbi:polyribonucleotide nucleotidyltransferase [Sediminispirochaeta smaragdinae]|jgi:polyribonucleotide nucleotidyltransferase|uniref:Polyribonucleotide nucleotidyltransferase n=1 Tax=Sediminispirochaeta smaragdinae (strain DSM 11293 / JCM 15392 / SEBR 4228) TaxID=573413 RepID=E1R1L4_SEDSS|nr:polyribonucleotide nucleotidyltransferase [Sediminispirochaeta smaragdinae]ADK81155.1 polyribonucleotide nucleotidyltransferase [Sediminispirochaeta smaragdinae DSM 11293]